MVLIIDNYDSFVYNLARYVNELGYTTKVVRNDAITIAEVEQLQPSHVILSPGPCTPDEAGICLSLLQSYQSVMLHSIFKGRSYIPLLGVCLGHQAIGQAFGGNVVRALEPMHGKNDQITHVQSGIFAGIASPYAVGRYHSLVVCPHTLPKDLLITARSTRGEIMAVQHAELPIFGVQFHPESILTEHGHKLLQNFLANFGV